MSSRTVLILAVALLLVAASAARQTKPDGTVTYELAWKDAKGKRHEATFKDDGTFVEEE